MSHEMILTWTVSKHDDAVTDVWKRVSSAIIAEILDVLISLLASPVFFEFIHFIKETLLAVLQLNTL
jgi:hypothetical protein